jgi:hypothetical protein
MSRSISIAIEGPGADRALDELLAIDGIVGEAQQAERFDPGEVTRGAEVLVAIGAIIGVAANIASIVSGILDWREKWNEAHAHQHLSVVIEDARGRRISLNDATPEQITAVLQSLQP